MGSRELIEELKQSATTEDFWSSWQTGFAVKLLYNYGYCFVGGICQKNPQNLYSLKGLFNHGLIILTIFFTHFHLWTFFLNPPF